MSWKRNRNRRIAPRTPAGAPPVVPQRMRLQMWVAVLSALAVMGGLQATGIGNRLEWLAGDALQRFSAARQPLRTDLRFVVLDQRSLDAGEAEFGLSWPWPREAYARVIRYLSESGARLVFLDFIFTEPSGYGPDDDEALAGALRNAGNVFLPVLAQTALAGNSPAASSAAETRARLMREQPRALVVPVGAPPAAAECAVSLPISPILAAAAGVGEARFTPGTNGQPKRAETGPFKITWTLIFRSEARSARFPSGERKYL